jgi:hypothetical protein
MARRRTKADPLDARISRLYGVNCSGITIPMLEIPAIFKVARAAVAADPAMDDAALAAVIVAKVEEVRVR